MSSSDSEDDCYGNVAKKLQSIKNKYQNNATKNCDTPTDSYQENKIIELNKINEKLSENALEDVNVSINSTDSEECVLDAIIANNSKRTKSRGKRKLAGSLDSGITSKRVTLSTRRNEQDSNFIPNDNEVPTNRRGRRRNIQEARSRNQPPMGRNITGRGSNKTTRGMNKTTRDGNKTTRGSNTPRSRRSDEREYRNLLSFLPIYGVGNTDEYPDMCDNQELFTSSNTDVVVVDECDPLDIEELSVKVYWQNSEVFRFKIRKYQKLTEIFDYFANRENVSNDKLLFTYNDQILKASDTPDTINYNIAKFIDGGIVNQNVTKLLTKKDDTVGGIKIKIQCQNAKKPYETTIRPEDKLVLTMMKYAEHIEKPYESLKFYFDGDFITGNKTALDLELEGGECIDVKLLS